MPDRTVVFWVLFVAAVGIFAWRSWAVLGPLRLGPPEPRFDNPWMRLKGVLRAVGFHERLLKIPYAGMLHALIFISFLVLATAIIETFGSGLVPGFTLSPIGGNTWIAFLQDIFALIMLVGVGMACWQRYFRRPRRFAGSKHGDATMIYLMIAAIVFSMLAEFACEIAAGNANSWRPVSTLISRAFVMAGLSGEIAAHAATFFYWLHAAAILAFLIYIPGSKHRHMLLAAPNVYFRSLQPKGRLPSVPTGRTSAGASGIDDLSWKHKLDLLACTECGRCQAACPAYAAGLPLSPKLLIMNLRDHMIHGQSTESLTGSVISNETIWACTTCHACMDACPVHIEHVPKIVELRRELVDEGAMEPSLQEALSNLQRSGNSMGQPARMRARWTRDLAFKIKDARKEPVDVLWFVGDYASFDQRVQPITRRIAELLHAAGVDFGLLYESEQNSGNDVRRVGEEGLFETLARSNIDTLKGCTFNRIMTADPHSLNALRNDYPALGAKYDVVHYTELFAELLQSGQLRIRPAKGTVTYHDPCYLGRYNGVFDPARRILEYAGYGIHEMPRCRENSFCCGAGGGRIWGTDAGVTERPSENRIREALALGNVSAFVVACPKDKVMYAAAATNLGVSERMRVVDVIELVEPLSKTEEAQNKPDEKSREI
jgi:Fe-S oxidoreductase